MTEFIHVNEEYVNSLVENAAWDAARVPLEEKRGDKKGDEGAGKDKKDKPDFTTDARKGDKSKTKPGKKDFEKDDDAKCEAVETHECPLCESVLEEALSDEVIYEHVSQIQEALSTIEEGGTNADWGDNTDYSPDENDPSEDDGLVTGADKDESKKSKIQKKVKALKAASKGK